MASEATDASGDNGGAAAESPSELGYLGHAIYGDTPPGGARACDRTEPLTTAEIDETARLIDRARREHRSLVLPEQLKTRDWLSIEAVVLQLLELSSGTSGGWKVGGAAEEVRRSEGAPSPSPGRIYRHTVFDSPARLGSELFINYRNCESELAFQINADFPPRSDPYTESDARAGIESVFGALEIGDTVFGDWYGASGYFGSSLDNGGSAALVVGPKIENWRALDEELPDLSIGLSMNGHFLKSGQGRAAMGHPVTSLTWMINWLRERGITLSAGEMVSTGTCTGHCFAARGDSVSADFGSLGSVTAVFQ